MSTKHYRVLFKLYIISLLAWCCVATPSSYAQEPTLTPSPAPTNTATLTVPSPTPAIAFETNRTSVADITFAQLGQSTAELQPPLSQWSFNFNIPYRWIVNADNTYVELHYTLLSKISNSNLTPQTNEAVVELYFNEVLLTTFSPVTGTDQVIRVPLTAEALQDPRQTDHQLRLVYFWQNCQTTEGQAPVIIQDNSFIHFEYQLAPLTINLADFPRPLTQQLFTPESAVIIIPDQYNQADLEAAAAVAATMGQQASAVVLSIITAAQATPERLAQTSAIIIGQPQNNRFLLDLYQRRPLPIRLTAGNIGQVVSTNQLISPDDGVLQEVPSDFSADHVYLIITGGSDEAVIRAAQALSASTPRYGLEGELAIISDFHNLSPNTVELAETSNLADLGFKDTTLYGIGAQSVSIRFFIPTTWRLNDKPTLTLSYITSALLQSSDSGLTLNLNNRPIASIPIGQTGVGPQRQTLELPAADLKPGAYNRLKIDVSINIASTECTLPELDQVWLRIMEDSQLNLPHSTVEPQLKATLKDALAPFTARQDLSDVWFAMPQSSTPQELQGLIHTTWWLGGLSSGVGFAPRVTTGVISDTTQLTSYQVIAFGRPTDNPAIALMNDYLPQPFMPGEDSLRQQVGNVVYRLPSSFSLGLLQALSAPWNPQKAVLVVTGTTPEGVIWAINTLTSDETYYGLKGDLAYIRGERIESFESTKFIRPPLENAVEAINQGGENISLESAPLTPTPQAVSSVEPSVSPPPTLTLPTPTHPVLTAATPPALIAPTRPISAALVPGEPISVPNTPGPIPEKYLPQGATPSPMVNYLIIGLIGAGLLVAAVGIFFNWRKTKIRNLS